MSTGTIRWFNKTKGYGFIIPDGEDKDNKTNDVFLHITVLEKTGLRYVEEGQFVQFDAEIRNGRLRAVSVDIVEAPIQSPNAYESLATL